MMKIMKNKGVEQRLSVRKFNTMLIFGFKNTYWNVNLLDKINKITKKWM